MPIVFLNGKPTVRCVSNHDPLKPLKPIEGTQHLSGGVAVRCYYCGVCGYVETYLAAPDGEVLTGAKSS